MKFVTVHKKNGAILRKLERHDGHVVYSKSGKKLHSDSPVVIPLEEVKKPIKKPVKIMPRRSARIASQSNTPRYSEAKGFWRKK